MEFWVENEHAYKKNMTTGQTNKRMDRQMPDKVIPMCCYASQVTQKLNEKKTLREIGQN